MHVRAGVLSLVAFAAGIGAWTTPSPVIQQILTATAAALMAVVVGLYAVAFFSQRFARHRLEVVMDFLQHDGAPGFCTDPEGAIFAQNRSALDRFGRRDGATMVAVFETLFANPDAVVYRLRSLAEMSDSAREDVVTRRGHVRVAVHRIPGGFLWRLEDLVDRAPRASDGNGLPILTFGSSGTILYMNGVLRGMVGKRAKSIEDVFDEVPLRSGQANRLRGKAGWETVRVVLSEPVNGRQEVFVLPVDETADGRVSLDALPVALLRLDADGHVISANRPARDLLPHASDGSVHLGAMVEGLGRSVREWVADAVGGRGLYRPEVVRVSGSDSETFLQVTLGRPLEGDRDGLLAVLNDATELKTMEAQFVQSQKMQAIGQLAGGVAHDFNNLLTAISGHCDLLLLRHGEGDEDYADLTQITQNANRAAALVGQLLAFSRKQTLEMQQVDLRDTLSDLAHLLNRLVGERVTLELDHDPALVPIRGDRRQLEQVLMNLVVNARDAMPEGGRIRIDTRCVLLKEPMIRDRATVQPGQYVVVSVSDEGVGISPDMLRRIFEPFFTTKRPGEGTGLGLSMAYGIVKQSGGFIFADSAPGKGATFHLYFPAEPPADRGHRLRQPLTPPAAQEAFASAVEPPPTLTRNERSAAAEPKMPAGSVPFADPVGSAHSGQRPAIADDARTLGNGRVPNAEVDAGPPAPAEATGSTAADPVTGPSAFADDVTATGDAPTGHRAAGAEPARDRAQTAPRSEDDLANVSSPEISAEMAIAALLGRQDPRTGTEPLRLGPPKRPLSLAADSPTRTRPAGAAGPGGGAAENASVQKPVVLLVEDEAPVRAFASRALRLRGYTVLEAANAEDALDALRDEGLVVDLFVTDVMMPGMDGPSWVREALKNRPTVRTVFMSGYMQDTLSEKNAAVPNSVFLPKPFSLSDLTRTVEDVLH
ncbi:ATP-binding protein [Jannaschia formosa]|uniref:ATP-binding protein n=1 Tax=Jannaschia formosa TaxID=2259592 RepID=UPI001FD75B91|nr:ATP-binding protein [Jannaschia formosa]